MSIQFKIPTLIATIVEQTNSKNKQPAKSPKSKGSSKACKVYKVQKSLIDELAKYPQHPFMEKLAEKFNINWNTANNQLKIEGSSEGISGASKSLRGITCAYLVPAFTQVNRINKFLNRVDDLSKDNDIPGMFDRGELENLNIIMFGLHNTNNQGRLIAQMKRYKKTLSNVIMCQQWYDQQITRILDFFKKIRKSQLYTDFVRKVTAELAKNLYSLDERSTNSTEVKLSPDQMTHLFDTYEGSEFFTNFTSNLSFDVVREECKLILHCSGKQKSDAIKRINTYFQILEMPFSTRPLDMRRDLSELLNNVALDYYLFDCKQLYNEIFGGDKVKSNLLRKLHGLLFVKYEFLEGMKHVDMVRNYLDILSTGRYILNHPQQMEVKAAVMYLFSPYPVNVNYQLLIALTTPPVIPRLNLENLGSVIKMLKTKISQVVGFCTDRQNYLKLAELALFESYLSLSNNSREAVHVVSAYLNNNFPFIK